MKKLFSLVLALAMILSGTALAEIKDWDIVTNAEDNKVILDCDMGYYGDDMWAMTMLAQADKAGFIELLGVTSVGGNEIVAVGANAILNQLEDIERTDIPVYMGTDIPLMGFRNLEKDQPVSGGFQWTGGYRQLANYVSPKHYHDLGELYDENRGYSKTEVQEQNAVDFMIEQVHKYPGKVTIFAIGACTNVALACSMDPTFAENTAGLIYMGAAIDVPGNANACGEFNWFYDPESVQVCLNNPFPYQVIVPHDISYHIQIAKDVMDKLEAKEQTVVTKAFLDNLGPKFKENPTKTSSVWDALTVAPFLCPDLIIETEFRDVAVDLNRHGYSYANAVTWTTGKGPYESTNCQIIFNLDREAFWNFTADLFAIK